MSKDAQLLRAMGMGPDERPELWWKATTPDAHPVYPLGLNLDPSEWTVEHDANFARVVWPWFRGLCHGSNHDVRTLITIHGRVGQPGENWSWSPNPGPTMCEAIYTVLCGEGD